MYDTLCAVQTYQAVSILYCGPGGSCGTEPLSASNIATQDKKIRFTMPNMDAQDATKAAVVFLSQYYMTHVPKGAKRDNGEWVVSVDVGLFITEIAVVTIDANTSKVVAYEMPGLSKKI